MKAGDSIAIDAGSSVETRTIANIGTEATSSTTLWQPLPDGPMMTIPVGSTNVPVTSAAGFAVGEKIALGYGDSYPAVARDTLKYEIATVTAVGKPGTQAWLGADAPAGATNIKVTSVANISVGDKIRLDIDSVGHGIETVTVAKVGTQATRSNLIAEVNAGATNIKVRRAEGFAIGDTVNVGTPANLETVTVSSVGSSGPAGSGIEISPVLAKTHIATETVMDLGSGLDLAAPLKFSHASNMPFSDRGTGISFRPATAFVHFSNQPVQALGTGITLSAALAKDHAIDAVCATLRSQRLATRDRPNRISGSADRPSRPQQEPSCSVTQPAWLSTASTMASSLSRGPPRVTRQHLDKGRLVATSLPWVRRPIMVKPFSRPAPWFTAQAVSQTVQILTAIATISSCRPRPRSLLPPIQALPISRSPPSRALPRAKP